MSANIKPIAASRTRSYSASMLPSQMSEVLICWSRSVVSASGARFRRCSQILSQLCSHRGVGLPSRSEFATYGGWRKPARSPLSRRPLNAGIEEIAYAHPGFCDTDGSVPARRSDGRIGGALFGLFMTGILAQREARFRPAFEKPCSGATGAPTAARATGPRLGLCPYIP
jgi:hypothetical protein